MNLCEFPMFPLQTTSKRSVLCALCFAYAALARCVTRFSFEFYCCSFSLLPFYFALFAGGRGLEAVEGLVEGHPLPNAISLFLVQVAFIVVLSRLLSRVL